ncbi:hypothetical protein N824_14325 [Pedobacter sp. V48]|nr:hypothetical protein N824_14325 [Pedobacter sp. V48]
MFAKSIKSAEKEFDKCNAWATKKRSETIAFVVSSHFME